MGVTRKKVKKLTFLSILRYYTCYYGGSGEPSQPNLIFHKKKVTGYIEIYIFRFIAQAKEKFNGTLYLHAAMNVKCVGLSQS